MKILNKIGIDHPLYKTGETHDSNGYVVLSSKKWGTSRNKRDHRVIIEKVSGRKLTRKEIIHHKDGNTSNNVLSNIVLMSRASHNRLHHGEGKELACALCGKKRWYSPALAKLLRMPYMCRKCYRVRAIPKTQKLSHEEALQIRRLRHEGVSGVVLAIRYGVSMATICDIHKGRRHR